MATLAALTSTLQSTVDGEAAALVTALENLIKLETLKGNPVHNLSDLEGAVQAACGGYLQTWLNASRAAGHTLYETATTS